MVDKMDLKVLQKSYTFSSSLSTGSQKLGSWIDRRARKLSMKCSKSITLGRDNTISLSFWLGIKLNILCLFGKAFTQNSLPATRPSWSETTNFFFEFQCKDTWNGSISNVYFVLWMTPSSPSDAEVAN